MDAEEVYALEKFQTALDSLATGPEGIRIRIRDAYMSFHPIQDQNFVDPELRALYGFIMRELTQTPAKSGEGSVQASLAAMSDEECVKVAEAILKMYDILREKQAKKEYAPDDEEHEE